jgi:hypothetical protein
MRRLCARDHNSVSFRKPPKVKTSPRIARPIQAPARPAGRNSATDTRIHDKTIPTHKGLKDVLRLDDPRLAPQRLEYLGLATFVSGVRAIA